MAILPCALDSRDACRCGLQALEGSEKPSRCEKRPPFRSSGAEWVSPSYTFFSVEKVTWLWLKKMVPKWNPGKGKHGRNPAFLGV